MGAKLDMVKQTTKDLQKMCKELGIPLHLIVSDGESIITTACGNMKEILSIIGISIVDLANQSGLTIPEVMSEIFVNVMEEEDSREIKNE